MWSNRRIASKVVAGGSPWRKFLAYREGFSALSPKRTLGPATMLHSEFPITPTWRANYQWVRLGQIR
jgi:hypothetical protein